MSSALAGGFLTTGPAGKSQKFFFPPEGLKTLYFIYLFIFKVFFFFSNFIIFGCAGSSLLHGLSLIAESRGYSLAVVCRRLIAVASPVAEHGL